MDFSKFLEKADEAGKSLVGSMITARGHGMPAPEFCRLLAAAVTDLRMQMIGLGVPRSVAVAYVDRMLGAAEREWSARGSMMVTAPRMPQ